MSKGGEKMNNQTKKVNKMYKEYTRTKKERMCPLSGKKCIRNMCMWYHKGLCEVSHIARCLKIEMEM